MNQPFHCARSPTDKAWHDPLRMKAQLITNLFFAVAGISRALHRWLSPFSFDRISPHPNFGYEIGTRYSPWMCNSRIKGNYSPYWIIMIWNYLFFLEIFVTSLSFYKKSFSVDILNKLDNCHSFDMFISQWAIQKLHLQMILHELM